MVAVAVSIWLVVGVDVLRPTVAEGGELATITAAEVSGVLVCAPSEPVTWRVMLSPLSPLPLVERSSVEAVPTVVPFRFHW